MFTRYGRQAVDGDYVIVLDIDYMHRRAANYIGKVYKNKAYTGVRMKGLSTEKYIHKLSAEIVISETDVPEEVKKMIDEDIRLSIKGGN